LIDGIALAQPLYGGKEGIARRADHVVEDEVRPVALQIGDW